MINLPDLLQRLRLRWLERVVIPECRIAKPFSLSVEEIPPLIPSVLSGDVIFNTEAEKKSVYLESGSKPSGIITRIVYVGITMYTCMYVRMCVGTVDSR